MKRPSTPRPITKLSYPSDWKAIALLPGLDVFIQDDSHLKEVAETAQAAYSLWLEILDNPAAISGKEISLDSPITGNQIVAKGMDLWDILVLKVACYYDYAIRILLAKQSIPGGVQPLQTFDWQLVYAPLERQLRSLRDGEALNKHRIIADQITTAYGLALTSIFFTTTAHVGTRGMKTMDVVSHKALLHLAHYSYSSGCRYLKLLATALTMSLLDYQIESYSANEEALDKEHREGVFSAIRLQELSLLARRDDSMIRKFGRKNVERVFEQQLSLIFQSLGLQVVSTRIGRQTVDLFCIASDQADGYSFMVEAKTTKGKYSLPKRDSRALRDYVGDVSSSLKSLPPLRFVLIIADEPSRTLPTKLTELSATLGMPARFCSASQLAALREALPGPMPAGSFRDEILRSEPLLSEDFASRIAQTYQAVQSAHVAFAEQLLDVRQGRPPGFK